MYVAQGLDNDEMAADACLSASTIKTYVSRLLDKLGLHTRAELVIFTYDAAIGLCREQASQSTAA